MRRPTAAPTTTRLTIITTTATAITGGRRSGNRIAPRAMAVFGWGGAG